MSCQTFNLPLICFFSCFRLFHQKKQIVSLDSWWNLHIHLPAFVNTSRTHVEHLAYDAEAIRSVLSPCSARCRGGKVESLQINRLSNVWSLQFLYKRNWYPCIPRKINNPISAHCHSICLPLMAIQTDIKRCNGLYSCHFKNSAPF